jgi:ABC transporter substrate binding protein (PQQ-dependent alcohol dehydrogenase system)
MVWHVAPSDSMLRNAGSDALAWDPSLERFGADTLNRRFQARFGQPMTGDAWAAWFAVKVVWETALRARSGEGARILALLPTMQFDGHKGVPLSFRAWDHQLRQPLYRSESGRLIQVPADASRATLDQLGTSGEASTCKE